MTNEIENSILQALSTQGNDICWIKTELNDLKTNCIGDLRREVGEMKTTLNKRPQMWTSAVITILCSTLVGLSVYLLTN